jgi:type I restriction enzyme R subunit
MVASHTQLRSKRELIEKFIEQNMPLVRPDEDVGEAFNAYWEQEKEAALVAICTEEGLDRAKFDQLVDHFNFSSQSPLRDDVVAALNKQPRILERRKIVNRILDRLTSFVRTFEDDFGDV